MQKTKLGSTGLKVSRTAFGALPIQRVSFDEAKDLMMKAFDNGINFFDTARMYSDSEEKLGYALSGVRKQIIIATKSHAKDKKGLLAHLETSLKNLKTDYVDILQLHNPKELPDPSDPDGLYGGLLEAKERGLIRHIGLTNHRRDLAIAAAKSGNYDTIQFPLNYLSTEEDLKLIDICKENNVGLIAMKAMSGGLISDSSAAFAFLRQYENVVPIWGVQHIWELDEFLQYEKNNIELNDTHYAHIDKDRIEISGDFCRACGYCLPCPANIDIPNAARISLLLRRAVYQNFMTDEFHQKMEKINDCINCGHCKARCPYGLDTPNLLKRELAHYEKFYEENKNRND